MRYDAIVAGVFVRAASASGRMDLPAPLAKLLGDLARATARSPKPFVTVFFGNPYAALATPDLPAILVTYDLYDLAESSAARALAGDAPITRPAADRAAGDVRCRLGTDQRAVKVARSGSREVEKWRAEVETGVPDIITCSRALSSVG